MTHTTYLRAACSEGRARVDASQAFRAGTLLLELKGVIATQPNRYSVQIGRNRHLLPEGDGCVWQFLNHSCKPNAAVVGRRLVAIREIAAGEEITFNYNCNEYDMDAPFRCHCGHCDEVWVRGYRHLSTTERERLGPYVAVHVRQKQREEAPAALAVHA